MSLVTLKNGRPHLYVMKNGITIYTAKKKKREKEKYDNWLNKFVISFSEKISNDVKKLGIKNIVEQLFIIFESIL